MVRLLLAALLWGVLMVAHLRTSRRKGSHREQSHGSWSANNPFESKRAQRRKATERGRKIATTTKPSSSSPDRGRIFAPKVVDDDDPFADPFADDDFDEPKSEEDKRRERYEAKLLRDAEKAERSRLYETILDAGGLKTRDELREEYSEIPNTFKRRDGMPGDELAEYLSAYYPEYGIETERDLIDFLAA